MLNRGAASRPARPLSAGARGRSAAVAGANRAAAAAAGSREAANARERALFLGAASPEAPGAPGAQAPSAAAARARRRSAAARLGSKSLAVLMAVILAVGLMPLPAFGDGGVVVNGQRVVAAAASSLTTVDADGNVTTESSEATLSGDGTVTVDGRRVPALDPAAGSLALYRLQRLTAGSATIADLKGYSSAFGLSPAAGIAAAAQRAEDEAAAALGAEDAAVDGRMASDPELAEQLAGMDFSTRRVVVALEDGASLQERDADCVASEGSGVYVLQYGDADSARRAYVRYLDREGVLFAAPDSAVEAADGAAGSSGGLSGGGDGNGNNGANGGSGSDGDGAGSGSSGDGASGGEGLGADAPVADLGSLDGGQQALAEDAERRESGEATKAAPERRALVALIDTAVPSDYIEKWNSEGGHSAELVGRVSAIGDAQPDVRTTDDGYSESHGARMLAAILEANPDARVLSIEALDETGYGSAATVYAALALATAARADVYSMSFAGYAVAGNEAIEAGVEEALQAAEDQEREVALLAAAGNQGADARFFVPASYDGVDAVGALDPAKLAGAAADELKADPQAYRQASSNFGDAVDLWAPGESTSFATATAAGALSDLFNSISPDNRMPALQSVLLAGAGSGQDAGADGNDGAGGRGDSGSDGDDSGSGADDDRDGEAAGGQGADGGAAGDLEAGSSAGAGDEHADDGVAPGPGADGAGGAQPLLGGLMDRVGVLAAESGPETVKEFDFYGDDSRTSQTQPATSFNGMGVYQIELNGAAGGGWDSSLYGGAGGRTVVNVFLKNSETIYFAVGGGGAITHRLSTSYRTYIAGGWNGGGGAVSHTGSADAATGSGGGATSVSFHNQTTKSLSEHGTSTSSANVKQIIAVAGGGGGAQNHTNSGYDGHGGDGGGVNGTSGTYNTSTNANNNGTQNGSNAQANAVAGSFLAGASGVDPTTAGNSMNIHSYGVSGGGGGWWGGSTDEIRINGEHAGGAGGGSGHIGGATAANGGATVTDAKVVASDGRIDLVSGTLATGPQDGYTARATSYDTTTTAAYRTSGQNGSARMSWAGYGVAYYEVVNGVPNMRKLVTFTDASAGTTALTAEAAGVASGTLKGWTKTAGSTTADYHVGETIRESCMLYPIYASQSLDYSGTDRKSSTTQPYTATLGTGLYTVELNGASGGGPTPTYYGGAGGRVVANVFLNQGETIYFAVGGGGGAAFRAGSSGTQSRSTGGWNGGGNAGSHTGGTTPTTGSGGGATSVSYYDQETSSLAAHGATASAENVKRIIAVAGGGGGGHYHGTTALTGSNDPAGDGFSGAGGDGGGYQGVSGTQNNSYSRGGADQPNYGYQDGSNGWGANGGNGGFLYGGSRDKYADIANVKTSYDHGIAGGGGGWYGGSTNKPLDGGTTTGGAGGGSSHIGGATESNGESNTVTGALVYAPYGGGRYDLVSGTMYTGPQNGYTSRTTTFASSSVTADLDSGANGSAKITWSSYAVGYYDIIDGVPTMTRVDAFSSPRVGVATPTTADEAKLVNKTDASGRPLTGWSKTKNAELPDYELGETVYESCMLYPVYGYTTTYVAGSVTKTVVWDGGKALVLSEPDMLAYANSDDKTEAGAGEVFAGWASTPEHASAGTVDFLPGALLSPDEANTTLRAVYADPKDNAHAASAPVPAQEGATYSAVRTGDNSGASGIGENARMSRCDANRRWCFWCFGGYGRRRWLGAARAASAGHSAWPTASPVVWRIPPRPCRTRRNERFPPSAARFGGFCMRIVVPEGGRMRRFACRTR